MEQGKYKIPELRAHPVFLVKPGAVMRVRVSFVSPLQTKRAQGNHRIKGQHITKIQPSNISERTLTTASAALLSFPMAQPAMRSQLLRPTVSHII